MTTVVAPLSACPDWCVDDTMCEVGFDLDGSRLEPVHRGLVTVLHDDGDFRVSARLESWKDRTDYDINLSVEINGEVDVPIEAARALGEYLIAMADQYAPQT